MPSSTSRKRRSSIGKRNDQKRRNKEKPEQFYTEDENFSQNKKFELTRFSCRYLFKRLEDIDDPLAMFKKALQNGIDKTLLKANGSNYGPDRLGIQLSSQHLTSDIIYHISTITANTIDQIVNLVSKVNYPEKNIFQDAFTLTVTTVNRNGLMTYPRTYGGRQVQVKHSVSENKLLKVNNRNNNLCLFYALEISRIYVKEYLKDRRLNQNQFSRLLHSQNALDPYVSFMLQQLQIPTTFSKYDAETYCPMVEHYYRQQYPGKTFKIYIFAEYGSYKPCYMTKNVDKYDHALVLFNSKHHFDGVRTMHKFFNNCQKYCFSCLIPYHSDREHSLRCIKRCNQCGRVGPDFPCISDGSLTFCHGCKKTFQNNQCYIHHIQHFICRDFKKCLSCGIIYCIKDLQRKHQQKHECDVMFCKLCNGYHSGLCFIQPLELKPLKHSYRFAFFDFECRQELEIVGSKTDKRVHEPNFIVLTVVCTNCIAAGIWNRPFLQTNQCGVCGKYRTLTFAPFEFDQIVASSGQQQQQIDKVFTSDDPLQTFAEYLLHQLPAKHKTITYAHNGGRYDNIIIFKKLFEKGICPELLRNGNKLFEMSVKADAKRNIVETIFRDSYNLVPFKLSSFIKAFDLQGIEDKQYFPYHFNREENYGKTLPNLPPLESYAPDTKLPKEREALIRWYQSNYEMEFNLNNKLAEYCLNDVNILTHGMIKFRQLFVDEIAPEFDILERCRTIAGAAMKVYQLLFLEEDKVGRVPNNCYNDNNDNQSLLAMKYMRLLEETMGWKIQSAESREGEFQIGGYKLDGYVPDKRIGIEINGCAFHACPRCYPDGQTILPNGKSAAMVRSKHEARMRCLNSIPGLVVHQFWECDIRRQLDENKAMKTKFEQYQVTTPALNVRSGFFGGRTAPSKTFFNADNNCYGHRYQIKYLDFTSLYPFVQSTYEYPVGHPELVTVDESERDVLWTRPEQIPWRGFIKVLVVPPQTLSTTPPILPKKFDERLLFPLCRQCSLKYPAGEKLPGYQCNHDEKDRQFIWVGTTLELCEAVKHGYTVKKVFSALHYDEFSDTIFKSYVNRFMALKIHASGFESTLQTVEQQDQYIKECWEKFGIRVERDKMKPDASMRTLSKLFLNSLWGKFCERSNLVKTVVTDSPAKFRQFLDNPRIHVADAESLSDDVLLLSYKTREEFVESGPTNNICIGAWTTSLGRLRLLEALQPVVRAENSGEKSAVLLYYDTDSVIYGVRDGYRDPLEHLKGVHLGEMKDEKENCRILEFVSGGPKNYCLQFERITSGTVEYEMKIRGICLDYNACRKLHYDRFKELCLAFGEQQQCEEYTEKQMIRPDVRRGQVCTVNMKKRYRPVIRKGIVDEQFKVLDFGYHS